MMIFRVTIRKSDDYRKLVLNVRSLYATRMTYLRMNIQTAQRIPPAPAANPTTPIIT